ncbi:MAG: sugar phosphorylase, partial [Chloroflexi bacterium]
MNSKERLSRLLAQIYGPETGSEVLPRLQHLLTNYQPRLPSPAQMSLTEKQVVLITYGDQVTEPGTPPLRTLANFCTHYLPGVVDTIHILPFYPYSSDDGFSVIDYMAVDPALGNWDDVAALRTHFRLMFDAVLNHVSAQSDWFQAFLRDDPTYRDYFVVVEPDTDVSAVFRPRALPLLTRVKTAVSEKLVWTTFSEDQIDLNYRNPDVLLKAIEILLHYISHGAEYIRLDAVAFLWKEIGTNCLHRPQTHAIIQLIRAVLDIVAPQVVLITETNVPHEENIAYFGDGTNEAQMVYNFSLPPLTLHAFHTGQAETLSQWASNLKRPSGRATFFNFLASHDGIGLTPAKGILTETDISRMCARILELGGYVSYRTQTDGTQSPYELNINYLDALGDPARPNEPIDLIARRFLTAHAIMLSLAGVPGIYFHSLFGSRSWPEGVHLSGHKRRINRQKFNRTELEAELNNPTSLRHLVYKGFVQLLQARRHDPAFHPMGEQAVLFLHSGVFSLLRLAKNGRSAVLCLHNITPSPQTITLSPKQLPIPLPATATDLLSHYPLTIHTPWH